MGTRGDQVQRPTVDGLAAELEEPGLGTALAVIVVAVAALLLAVVPAVVALEDSLVPVGWVAAALGGFAGFIFSLKLGAIVWGMAVQLWGARPARADTENAE